MAIRYRRQWLIVGLTCLGPFIARGVATSVLSWRVRAVGGGGGSGWAVFQGRPLLAAVESGFVLLAFAVLAAVLFGEEGASGVGPEKAMVLC